MSLVSYIMSKENFDNEENPLLLNKFKDAKKYIRRCIHEDGDISEELNLGSALESFDQINNVESDINEAINEFNSLITNSTAFTNINEKFQKEINYQDEFGLVPITESDDHNPIGYNFLLTKINELAQGTNKRWSTDSNNEYECSDELPSDSYYHPKNCNPYELFNSRDDELKAYSEIVNDINIIIDYAKTEANEDSVIKVISTLKEKYEACLSSYTGILEIFSQAIIRITSIVRRYSSDENAFSFLNGKFIGINLKIILKYLKFSLGTDLYTVGLCLIIVGFSLILSISSTIFLLVMINLQLKKNTEVTTLPQIVPVTSPGANIAVSHFQSSVPVDPKY